MILVQCLHMCSPKKLQVCIHMYIYTCICMQIIDVCDGICVCYFFFLLIMEDVHKVCKTFKINYLEQDCSISSVHQLKCHSLALSHQNVSSQQWTPEKKLGCSVSCTHPLCAWVVHSWALYIKYVLSSSCLRGETLGLFSVKHMVKASMVISIDTKRWFWNHLGLQWKPSFQTGPSLYWISHGLAHHYRNTRK